MSPISLLTVIKSKFIPCCTANIMLNQKICMLAQWTSPPSSQRPLKWNFTTFFWRFRPILLHKCSWMFFFESRYPISFERTDYFRSNKGLLLSLRCMVEIVDIFFWLFANLAVFESFLAGNWWKITFLVFFCSDRILCIKSHRIRYGRAKSEKKVVYCRPLL